MKTVAIIVAGGQGKRMGKPKQFLKIVGRPMLEWALSAFQKAKVIDGIILVVEESELSKSKHFHYSKLLKVVAGGKERQDSVKNGLKELPATTAIVVIHDGARPAVTPFLIEQSVKAARKYGAAIIGVPAKDTIKEINNSMFIKRTVDRSKLWQAQTPQTFRASIIRKAYTKIRGKITDDAMPVEKLNIPVKMIMGSYENLKMTTPEDLKIMEAILTSRKERR